MPLGDRTLTVGECVNATWWQNAHTCCISQRTCPESCYLLSEAFTIEFHFHHSIDNSFKHENMGTREMLTQRHVNSKDINAHDWMRMTAQPGDPVSLSQWIIQSLHIRSCKYALPQRPSHMPGCRWCKHMPSRISAVKLCSNFIQRLRSLLVRLE